MEKSKLINKVDSTTAEIYMYGVIGSGLDIDANVVVAEIENLRKKGCRNFRFYVNSEGGEVIQGSALFNYLDRTDIEVTAEEFTKEIHTACGGRTQEYCINFFDLLLIFILVQIGSYNICTKA